ncbi:peroxiredoxin family protein [Chitinophaga sancti]|uniref:AhpC/TSA family protein n=1 Tax=Chitinophaga sancti TaxID=1004 RepID=A0A1K1T0F3_9BACT|nr:redoxin domain-containing protein [Chitinophaga sancti]WQD59567.1 redoxin domain-containing protein [Chitinophaga sancti]WQG88299.1 redoxin domain-containing protein [Chitinophaga sancti]SFW89972.1 AhpC/TSA family protein [Chitinophaga sancti]
MKVKSLSLVFLLFIYSCSTQDPIKTGKEGKAMPSFTYQVAKDEYHNTSEIPSGSKVVFVYFRTHCPYCQAETEDILGNINHMDEYKFYFISADTLPSIEHFIDQHRLNDYANVRVGRDTAHFFSKYFNTIGAPYTAIYNKNKILKAVFMGKIGSREIQKY